MHVNLALILKFMPKYFSRRPSNQWCHRQDPVDDEFLFRGRRAAWARSRSPIGDWPSSRSPSCPTSYGSGSTRRVTTLLRTAARMPSSRTWSRLVLGQLFTLIVYAQLILEQAELTGLDPDVLDTIFEVFVRDFSALAVELHGKASSTEAQQQWALANVRKPVIDTGRFERCGSRSRRSPAPI